MQSVKPQNSLDTILKHVQSATVARSDRMDIEDSASAEFDERLNRTLQKLQDQVAEQRRALETLRESSDHPAPRTPSSHPQTHTRQLQAVKASYENLTNEKPSFPSADSPIPSLIATRVTEEKISGLKHTITDSQSELERAQSRLEDEERNLRDNNLITVELEKRIAKLREERLQQSQKSPTAIADGQIKAKQKRKQNYIQDIDRLQRALDDFIKGHLAAMLAAEELGGPTVGDMLEISEEILENGFSAQGKPKTTSRTTGKPSSDQMRIDRQGNLVRGTVGQQGLSEKDSAAVEMRHLLDSLFTALLEGESSSGHITPQRDSAASRFLVRAKVAQFHPKDARRLRLIDFGRELDD
ncbi:MAG: hypothetical protein M1820_009049 [Bogoriella megaspora]|nr:MAG: hypothetical protein M1820_009049 [Bogoriella megaspora]